MNYNVFSGSPMIKEKQINQLSTYGQQIREKSDERKLETYQRFKEYWKSFDAYSAKYMQEKETKKS